MPQFSLANRREIDLRAILRGSPRLDLFGRCRQQFLLCVLAQAVLKVGAVGKGL